MNESKKTDKLYKISTYNGEKPYQTQIVEKEVNSQLSELMKVITTTSWSPATFRYVENYKTPKNELVTGKYRSNDTFMSLNLLVYDVDGNLTIHSAVNILKELGYEYYILTTKNHQKQKGDKPSCDRYRIILPLSREVTSKDEYFLLWKHLSHLFKADPACKDVARYYQRSIELVAYDNGSEINVDQTLSEYQNANARQTLAPTIIPPIVLGRLSKKTIQFIENGRLPNENWHERFFKAATDLREQGYSIEEAHEKLTLASKNEFGFLDETDEKQLKDVYSRSNRYPQRPLHQSGKPPQTEVILSLVKDTELFQSEEGDAYIATDAIGIVFPIKSESAYRMIADLYYKNTNSIPDPKNVKKALDHLCFLAQKLPKIVINYRIAREKNNVIIDRGSKENGFIEVTADGWSLTSNTDLKFIRHQNMKELPIPIANGNIHDLRHFINLGSDSDFIILISFIVGCFFKSKQYPIAVFQGPQGSGKSTLTEILKMLIDPGVPTLRSLPTKEEDLFIAAKHSHLLCFDNLSRIKPDLSDTLCKISTGAAIAGRMFFTNTDEYFIQVCRPFVINGIDDLIYRPDLADRSLVFHLPKITETSRALDSKMKNELADILPSVFGSILDGISSGLKNFSTVNLKEKLRLADFGVIACASLLAYGYTPDQVHKTLQSNRRDLGLDTIESNPIAQAIVNFMFDKSYWEGTASELAQYIKMTLDAQRVPYFGKTPNVISREINRITPELKFKNIIVDRIKTNNARILVLKKISSLPPLPPPPPPPNAKMGNIDGKGK